MYEQRLQRIIYFMETNQEYKNLALLSSARNNKPYPSLTIFFQQPGVPERVYEALARQWDSQGSRFFRNLTEQQKSLFYTLFLFNVYKKFHKELGLDLTGYWDKTFEKICVAREMHPFLDVETIMESQDLFIEI